MRWRSGAHQLFLENKISKTKFKFVFKKKFKTCFQQKKSIFSKTKFPPKKNQKHFSKKKFKEQLVETNLEVPHKVVRDAQATVNVMDISPSDVLRTRRGSGDKHFNGFRSSCADLQKPVG